MSTEWSSDLQHTTWALTGLERQSDDPDIINWLVASSPSTYMLSPKHILQSAPLANFKTFYFVVAKDQLHWEDRILFTAKLHVYWKSEIGLSLIFFSQLVYTGSVSLSQPRWMNFHLINSLYKLDSMMEHRTSEKLTLPIAFSNKSKYKSLEVGLGEWSSRLP